MLAETKESLNEECGVFGIWGDDNASQLTYFGLHSLRHRVKRVQGIVSCDEGKLLVHRNLGLIDEVFKDEADLQRLTGNRAIRHMRYSTSGQNSIENVQPFCTISMIWTSPLPQRQLGECKIIATQS